MKTKLAASAILICSVLYQAQAQYPLSPSGPPAPTQKSLQEIWDTLSNLEAKIDGAAALIPNLLEQVIPPIDGLVGVVGGTLPESSPLGAQTVGVFYLGKTEVTASDWESVRTFAVSNGYDLAGIGEGSAPDHPVRNVNWYDAVKWCNAKSEMEGLTPVYTVGGNVFKSGQSAPPDRDPLANGYRLPTEAEWEWAARGGIRSQGFTYSGSNDQNAVGWNMSNSENALVDLVGGDNGGRGTFPVGQKLPNELGTYDMSGNVAEWCWDAKDSYLRYVRGGAFWIWGYGAVTDRYWDGIDDRNVAIGFRVVRGLQQCP